MFESFLHRGARGDSKVYVGRTLAFWAFKARYSRVRIPPYATIAYRQWFGNFVLRDAKNGTRNRVQERFCFDHRYHSAKREALWYISQSNAKASLA